MQSQRQQKNRREPVICDRCGTEMVFGKDIFESSKGDHLYVKYVCPCRQGELGCGAVKMVRFAKESDLKFRLSKKLSSFFAT